MERERYVCTKEDNSKLKEQSQTRGNQAYSHVCVSINSGVEYDYRLIM